MKYLLKIWLTTCIIAPLIIISINTSGRIFNLEVLSGFFYVLICGLLLSTPAMSMLFLILKYTDKYQKIILSIVSLFSVFITFYLVGSSFTDYELALIYGFVMVISVLVYRI